MERAGPGLLGQVSLSTALDALILTFNQEWREGLRTALHPWIFALAYKAADAISTLEGATRVARAENLLVAPKIAQAIFAAVLDLFTWKLGQRVHGAESTAALATVSGHFHGHHSGG